MTSGRIVADPPNGACLGIRDRGVCSTKRRNRVGQRGSMEDEIVHLVKRIESNADGLQQLGRELVDGEAAVPADEASRTLLAEALALSRQIEGIGRAVSELAKRCDAASMQSSEINALRDVAAEIAGELGSLAAIVDLATGEIPGCKDCRPRKEVGGDILRTARDLRQPALKLSRIRAMKSPKRFAVGTSVRVRNPGVDGVVTNLDNERSALSEYWHTIKTKQGERREPGCNLELIEPPIAHAAPGTRKIADTINFHGPNSRLTVNGNDNSSNTVLGHGNELFEGLRQSAASIGDERDRNLILERIDELERTRASGGFLDAYKAFMAALSDHITVFAPFLPALAQMLGIK